MTTIFIIYMVFWGFVGFWAGYHANDVDEEGYFKFPWRMWIFMVMFLLIPVIAKISLIIV